MIGNKKKIFKSAFTLIEVLISVTLFAVIILSVTSIFKLAIDGQRNAIATQNVQESLKYFLEVTAKEIRMAQKDRGVCGMSNPNSIFFITEEDEGDILSFKNYYGECVKYYLADDNGIKRFQISRQAPASALRVDFISPEKIKINDLHFIPSSNSSTTQPMITINLNASSIGNTQFESDMTLQTSVTSRYYK
ncbi:MAG: PilW family protein [Patescibacteria group bacterium]